MARKKKVTFKFKATAPVHDVKLCGNFTEWEKGAIVMTRGRGGEWKADVNLEPGNYEYKFCADGAWFTDPKADQQTHNSLGSENSLRQVR
jgi:hypothetical protein